MDAQIPNCRQSRTSRIVGSVKHTDLPKETAHRIKEKLGIDSEWTIKQSTWSDALSELKNRIEKAGIFLSVSGIVGLHTHRPLDPKEFRGFVLVDKYAPFIFVNNNDFKAAQMFTLAHELAHVWIGRSAAFDLRHLEPANDAVEKACSQIAAEFLVPGRTLSQQWAQFNKEHDPFQAGARYFKVSEIVVARRALDIKIIDRDGFLKFYNRQQEKAKHNSEQRSSGNFYNTVSIQTGKTFMKTSLMQSWRTSYSIVRPTILPVLHANHLMRCKNALQSRTLISANIIHKKLDEKFGKSF